MTDPSRTSFYLTDAYYAETIAAFDGAWADEREITDAADRDSCCRFLEREARILDERRLDDWLSLFVPECVYWVPATPDAGDPRKEITVTFDDRRRLEDRVYRLQTDAAWSQQPQSRTSRTISNVALFKRSTKGEAMARSLFLTTEFRNGETRRFAGWNGYRLKRDGDAWAIVAKRINLIDCDRNLRNPSIIL